MAPTLPAEGLVLVGKRAHPEAGDIVLMRIGEDPERYFKRVLAVAGEEIAWEGGGWSVDGRPLGTGRLIEGCTDQPVSLQEEGRGGKSWWASPPRGAGAKLRVPEGHLFVAGDWREASRDSRHWGPVSLAEVDGVALVLLAGRRACADGGFPGAPLLL